MGKVVAGQARQLEVRNLEQQAAVFGAERHEFGEIKINAAAINKRRLRLIVARVVAHADERIIQPNSWDGRRLRRLPPARKAALCCWKAR